MNKESKNARLTEADVRNFDPLSLSILDDSILNQVIQS